MRCSAPMTDKNPSDLAKAEPKQRGARQGGCAGIVLVVLTLVGIYLLSPLDPPSVAMNGCVIAAMLAGMYLLGVRDGRRE